MGKKTKSKDRLDKFYRYAKEQGYRSRAAFKLIQLNKKYHFLENSTILVDLCAAPGGWLQVASKHMQSASIIVGVDLDPIKPIPNVKTFLADITTQRCLDLIRGEVKHMKADVVLNDGAPNVGSDWMQDAYNQCELVMHSLKLATQVLKKGGYFITKIFRSQHYMSLIWLFNKFFDSVEANKPEASRTQSAEIFVVCSKYKNPDYIDPKFFDPKWVFKNTEGDFMKEINDSNIHSIKKVFEKVRRPMIKDDAPSNLFKRTTLSNFIKCENPYVIFAEFNAIDHSIDTIDSTNASFKDKRYCDLVKYPDDFEETTKDLKLLSKSQVSALLKWRSKVQLALRKASKLTSQSVVPKEAVNEDEENHESEAEEEKPADAEYHQHKKDERIKEKMKEKQMYKFIKDKFNTGTEAVGQENEVELADFDFTKHQKQIRKGKYQNIEDENFENILEERQKKKTKMTSYAEMCDNIEYLYEQKLKKEVEKTQETTEDNKMVVSEILNKKIKKKETAREKLKNKNKIKSAGDGQTPKNTDIDFSKLKTSNKWFDNPAFDLVMNQEEKNDGVVTKKVELKREKEDLDHMAKDENSSSDESSDSEHAYNDLDEENGPDLTKMNDDDLAQMIVLSKKMLRKKTRREIIDASYNRYNYPEDPATLPKWFTDDERKHIGAIPQITKEEVEAEKARLRLLKNQLPKKVLEAKYRKKKRVVREMKKAESEVKQLFEEDNLNFSKAKQISGLYKRAIRKSKEKPKKIVFMKRQFSGAPRKKSGRKFMVVDKRGKKDLRNGKLKKKK